MSIAYKYCETQGGIAVLESCELKVTPPNQFNDPFEFTPHQVCSDVDAYVRRIIRSKANQRKLYEMLKQEGKFDGTFREFRGKAQAERSEMIELIKIGTPLSLRAIQKELPDRVSEKLGLLCLSKRPASILMWGHYADKHRGLVIGFDCASEVFRSGKGLRDVNYVKERVCFDATWRLDSVALARFNDEVLLSKNADWAYEEEQRQIFALSTLKQKPLADGTKGYFLPFAPTAVVQVILGARCSPDLQRRVTQLVASKFPAAKVLQAKLHESQFALVLEPVTTSEQPCGKQVPEL